MRHVVSCFKGGGADLPNKLDFFLKFAKQGSGEGVSKHCDKRIHKYFQKILFPNLEHPQPGVVGVITKYSFIMAHFIIYFHIFF